MPIKFRPGILFILIAVMLLQTSCTQRGCMDKDAENYKPKATQDCECCIFYSKGWVWYTYETYKKLEGLGVSSLVYYVNGVRHGQSTKGINGYWRSGAPAEDTFSELDGIKDSDGNIIVVNMGNRKRKNYFIRITDQNNKSLFQDSVLMKAGIFMPIEIR